MGYFRIDAMPYRAVIHLITGGNLTIVDATRRHKLLTDALKFGIPTWCLVFNRAIRERDVKTCDWETPEMRKVANLDIHKPLVQSIRKIVRYYNGSKPAIIGENISLECYQGFIGDDKPHRIKTLISNLSHNS
jgi:hypothetical protein